MILTNCTKWCGIRVG